MERWNKGPFKRIIKELSQFDNRKADDLESEFYHFDVNNTVHYLSGVRDRCSVGKTHGKSSCPINKNFQKSWCPVSGRKEKSPCPV